MFDKGDVEGGSGEQGARQDCNEFSYLAHRFLPAIATSHFGYEKRHDGEHHERQIISCPRNTISRREMVLD